MNNIIKRYINNLTKEDIKKFASKNNIELTNDEISMIYDIVINEYELLISDSDSIFIKYKAKFSSDNYTKIYILFNEYKKRYKHYL